MIRGFVVAAALAGGLALAGCGASSDGRIGADLKAFDKPIGVSPSEVATWRLAGVSVTVPETLTVSTNPHVQFPAERIVWWEDPDGDRRAQVDDIMTAAISRGAAGLQGSRRVTLEATVNLFHAVTPKARGGLFYAWHDIAFSLTVRDAATGAVLAAVPEIDADIEALRREAAEAAVAAGETQKVRISRRVAQAVQLWLASGTGIGAE